ncbi:TlyA family RNA methyltransferase [Anaerosalibacter sp. Marseille-P3206]|uniref:TlyA family RNA methyltransferase n=1 Tax=Anaerosalibacter sp. Marseille-P3206 TaxID=1871005 RepID=UPI0009876C32|nr:TlyA family RNA methyltransferase [Anaerosalibacter sp. Marseille-P3206]
MRKERVDILLADKKLVESREKGKRLIMAGIVYVDGKRVDKPGEKVDINSVISIKGNPIPYVSRGGLKLEKAIDFFDLNLKNKVCIDIGASTGGFTDCMLQNGAKRVYAIDVGYGQIDWKIRQDERVILKERTNIRYVTKNDLGELANFISIDVSFISLKLVLPVAKELLDKNGEIVALIKPQFEAGREKVGKKGIVRDKSVHEEVLLDMYNFCSSIGLFVDKITYSPIKGGTGNIEYLFYIRKGMEKEENTMQKVISEIVIESHNDL